MQIKTCDDRSSQLHFRPNLSTHVQGPTVIKSRTDKPRLPGRSFPDGYSTAPGSRVIRGRILAETSQLHNATSPEPPHETHSDIVPPGSPPPLCEEVEGGYDCDRLPRKTIQLVVNAPPSAHVHGVVQILIEYRSGEDERDFPELWGGCDGGQHQGDEISRGD